MKLPFALFGLIAFAASSDASAAGYPERPIRLIVGYAAGGSTDVLARLVGSKLSQLVGQQVIVENKPGANSNIASEYVAHSAPDGYTLEVGGASSAINESLYRKLPFSFGRDFSPIAMIGSTPSVMVVPKTLPVQSPAE